MAAKTYGPYIGVVDLVHDGDTVDVKLDIGFDLTVYTRCRIKGINAPELSTDAGKLARDFAKTLCPTGTEVTVMSFGWDKYGGRTDCSVKLPDGTDFAQAMIDSGHAVVYNP